MGDLTWNFSRLEFACKCGCGFDTVDVELIKVLERVRGYFGKPVIISGGNRCPYWNQKQGGAPESKHMLAQAADIKIKETDPRRVFRYLANAYPDKYGIGLYHNRVHIDVRTVGARWSKV